MTQPKIIVLDDDPTGSQTVHGCLLLTRWDVATLKQGLNDASPLMFVLTNTRGMGAHDAEQITREVCHNLKTAMKGFDRPALFVSRSDSTLRGHYPIETDVMEQELGPFDAHFLTPAFFEGGRFTMDSVHYVRMGDKAVPAHETEFAKDSVFGYKHSFLPDYVEEKTKGRIKSEDVVRLSEISVRCCERVQYVLTLLPKLKNAEVAESVLKTCEEIDKLESDADRVMRSAMSALFREEPDTRQLIKLKAVYEHLESISDRCEDVANLVEGIVLENS